ncbi:MAG: F0F1 ATP synthase subunit delta [Candidatus Saccharibacteria bacterium]|nr:F0F1 ATP synthase subunit delta [Candidatus Saccharibacteria bacterium]
MTNISRRQVARYAAKQLADGVKNRKVAQYLAAYLHESKTSRQIDLLIADIALFLHQEYGHSAVQMSSMHELTAELKRQIVKNLGITGNLEINETIDSELLGGVVVTSAGKEYDGSVKTSIKQLKALGN